MPTAVIFVWSHGYNAVSAPGAGIGRALESLGYQVAYVNAMDPNSLAHAIDSSWTKCNIAISMGAPPLSLRIEDKWLFEIFGEVFYLYSLDSIFYDSTRVPGVEEFVRQSISSTRLRIMSPDLTSASLFNTFSPETACYVPFGGLFLPLHRFEKDRLRRIAVVGTIGGELADVQAGTSFGDLVDDAPEAIPLNLRTKFARMIERPGASPSILLIARDFLGIAPDVLFSTDVCRYIARLDAFQKRRRRTLAIQALRDYPLDFYGPGWETVAVDFRNSRFLGSITYEQIGEVCQSYAALLNFDPNWAHGLHDRVYTAVGNGCRVMTNTSGAIDDISQDVSDCIFAYDPNNPVLSYAADRAMSLPPMPSERMLEFRSNHSWLSRMDRFLACELG